MIKNNMETQRLVMTEIESSDIQFIYKGLSHPEVIKYYGVSFHSLEATEEQMQWYADLKANNTGIWWLIRAKETGECYGACGFNDKNDELRKAEIGFWLLPDYWGQGIMVEVMPHLLHYGFKALDLNRIEGFVDSENSQCKKALKKAGFLSEGQMKVHEAGQDIILDVFAKMKTSLSDN